jgi:hypothetical protein
MATREPQTIGVVVLEPLRVVRSALVKFLADVSDIVVRGAVLRSDHATQGWPEPEIPPGELRPQLDAYRTVHTVQFQVHEYLKGSGPQVVTVFQSAPIKGPRHNPELELRQGGEYILFLFSTQGAPPWGDGYLIMGPTQGYWRVEDGTVRRPFGWKTERSGGRSAGR